VLLGLASILGALGAFAVPKALARIRRERALARALQALGEARDRNSDTERSALVAFPEPEALLALAKEFESRVRADPPSSPASLARELVFATELFALEPEPRDPRPREAFERLTRALEGDARCWALYLLDELQHPRQAREPEGFAPSSARIDCPWGEGLNALRALSSWPIEADADFEARIAKWTPAPESDGGPRLEDTPWRALVRLAQSEEARVVIEGRRVLLVPTPSAGFDTGSLLLDDGFPSTIVIPRSQATRANRSEPLDALVIRAAPPAVFLRDPFATPSLDLGTVDHERALRILLGLGSGLELVRTGERTFDAVAKDRRAFIARLSRAAEEIHPRSDDPDLPSPHYAALLRFDEPEAFLAVLDAVESNKLPLFADDGSARPGNVRLLLYAGELAAAATPDPRVRERIEKLARTDDRRLRFLGLYLLEELREPSFPAPPPELAQAPGIEIVSGTKLDEAVAAISSATTFEIDFPKVPEDERDSLVPGLDDFGASAWRALVHALVEAQDYGVRYRLVRTDRAARVELAGEDPIEGAYTDPERDARLSEPLRELVRRRPLATVPDSRKGLRALAALEGSELREEADGKLSLEPRK
jgi:hypothetical protein